MEKENQKIKFLKKEEVGKGIYSFVFEKSAFEWRAGQHAVFRFEEEDSDYRFFTISSSPNEKKIMFTTLINDNPSKFKRKLMNLKLNDEIFIKGPYGEFLINRDSKKVIGVAGGIGITPFRALGYELAKNDELKNIKLELIFSARKNNHAFKKELEEFKELNNNIVIYYTEKREQTQEKLIELINENKNDAYYFISGKPKMVESIKDILQENKILSSEIKTDPFEGYSSL